MLQLSYDEKIELMESLNWDYLDSCDDMLAVSDSIQDTSDGYTPE